MDDQTHDRIQEEVKLLREFLTYRHINDIEKLLILQITSFKICEEELKLI